jgi:hypothetical protein
MAVPVQNKDARGASNQPSPRCPRPARLCVFAATLQPQCGAQSETAPRIHPANAKPCRRHEIRPHLDAADIRWNHRLQRTVAGTEASPTSRGAFSAFSAQKTSLMADECVADSRTVLAKVFRRVMRLDVTNRDGRCTRWRLAVMPAKIALLRWK